MNITIRPGTTADADALAEIAARTFRDTFNANTHPDDVAVYIAEAYGPSQQRRELTDPQISTLLAHEGDGFAGYAQLRQGPAPACVAGDAPIELWRFYVSREWHGRGIAQQLMQAVEIEAGRTRAGALWLGVWEQNERAKAFYRKCGFADVGSHIFLVGSDPQTDRIMTKPLI